MKLLLIGTLIASVVSFGVATRLERGACIQRELATTKLAQEKYDELSRQYNAASEDLERSLASRRAAQTQLAKKVEGIAASPSYSRTCLDDVGLRAANAALGGFAPGSGEPDDEMPATPTP